MERQLLTTETFWQSLRGLTPQMRKIVMRKVHLLIEQPQHPSLQPHRVQQCKENVWIVYISRSVRLLYQYKGNIVYLHEVGTHAIVDKVQQRNFSIGSEKGRIQKRRRRYRSSTDHED